MNHIERIPRHFTTAQTRTNKGSFVGPVESVFTSGPSNLPHQEPAIWLASPTLPNSHEFVRSPWPIERRLLTSTRIDSDPAGQRSLKTDMRYFVGSVEHVFASDPLSSERDRTVKPFIPLGLDMVSISSEVPCSKDGRYGSTAAAKLFVSVLKVALSMR